MTKQANDVVNKIAGSKLADYGIEREAPTAKTTAPRKTYTQKYTPKPATSYADYAKRVPAIQTPSAFSKAKVDEVLMRCRELPTPDKPQKNYAGYSRKEWDMLVDVVSGYMLDVVEGAGLISKGSMSGATVRKHVSLMMQEAFMHEDPYDKKRRFISVDGRIDSDERKP